MRQVLIVGLAAVACSAVLAAQGTQSRTVQVPSAAAGQSAPAAPRPVAGHAPVAGVPSEAEQTALIAQYCASCHSARGKAGGLSLAGFDAAKADAQADVASAGSARSRPRLWPTWQR